MSKTRDLRELVESPDLTFIMEAHDGMSAKVVQETGFKAIWASGLSISNSLGYRDNNELSFSQVADHCYHISRCVDIPVLVDCDTMYGDFNTARVALNLFERAGVAGVVIEDKNYPKKNSFLNNGKDALADPDEFALKIRSLQDSKSDKDFLVVARVESFLVGNGIDDAIYRANKYVDEGHADAILIHSKRPDAREIESFMNYFDRDVPVIIVPTKYYSVSTDYFRYLGINSVIWANHNMRAAMTSMRNVSRRIYEEESLIGVEDKLVTVSDVFKFQGNEELEEMEKLYLPNRNYQAAILAASDLDDGTPKPSIEIKGSTILGHQIEILRNLGIDDIKVVVGDNYQGRDYGESIYVNYDYKDNYEIDSLKIIHDIIDTPLILLYGDIIFRKYIIRDLMESESDIAIAVSHDMNGYRRRNGTDYVFSDRKYDPLDSEVKYARSISRELSGIEPDGVFIGALAINNEKALEVISGSDSKYLGPAINECIRKGFTVEVQYVLGESWADINTVRDIIKSNSKGLI